VGNAIAARLVEQQPGAHSDRLPTADINKLNKVDRRTFIASVVIANG
jgi:hypothetical protein